MLNTWEIHSFCQGKDLKIFQFLIDGLQSKLASWKAHTLSWVGRATMIPPVANGLALYAMSVFHFPKKITSKMDSIIEKFWWGRK